MGTQKQTKNYEQEVKIEEYHTIWGTSNVLKVELSEDNMKEELNSLVFRLKTDDKLLRPEVKSASPKTVEKYRYQYPRVEATTPDGFTLDFGQTDEVEHILARLEYTRELLKSGERNPLMDAEDCKVLLQNKIIDFWDDINKFPVPNKDKQVDTNWVEEHTDLELLEINVNNGGTHLTAVVKPIETFLLYDIMKEIEKLFQGQKALDRVTIDVNGVKFNTPSGLTADEMYQHLLKALDEKDFEMACQIQNGVTAKALKTLVYDYYID